MGGGTCSGVATFGRQNLPGDIQILRGGAYTRILGGGGKRHFGGVQSTFLGGGGDAGTISYGAEGQSEAGHVPHMPPLHSPMYQ